MSGISSSPSLPATTADDLRVKMHRLVSVFLEEVTFDDLRAVVRALVKRAVEGCFQAAKLTLAYVLGRPHRLPEAPTGGEQASRLPVGAAPPALPAAAPAAAATDSKRVVTASAPPPVVMTPEMEAFLSAPMTPDEREELRREALLLGRPPKANGGDGGSRQK
jgi:hypothetical protein